ncbi:MAG: protein kinase [Gammaproteobacteria bacterium]|nr:protein kinase [Candidatus Brocadiales bacterium]MBL7003232.1 protein kinase [Gammaproteobacteria bacterium]
MQLEGYTGLTKFAQGGMATLYKGHQTSLDRPVVIKLLSVQSFWDKTSKMLFDQESLVIAKLTHPNIVHIIDRGHSEKGRPYFVMEYIKGMNLAEFMKTKKITAKHKISILMQCSKGIAFAHKNGIIHRDIKPANILINTEGHIQVLDFGIAWIMNMKHDPNSKILGTPDYMSPEQFSSPFDLSHLTDIYSFGVVMYELFTHKLPTEHLENIADSIDFVPRSIAELVEQCLELRPELRPQSMDEVRVRLLKGLQGAHISDTQRQQASNDIGKTMEKFVLLDVIKNNEFGAVYLSEEQTNKNLIIIKKRTQSRMGFDEARLLMKIDHPNIIRILGVSKNKNAFIVVMDHLAGGNLQDRLSRPFNTKTFLRTATQICQALQVAHENKITHKNLRPSNILYDKNNNIFVSDFGFDEHYSGNNKLKGWYHPPKHFGSDIVNDIYSAGSMFYHMLTGEPMKLNHKKIEPNPAFLKLSEAEQTLIKNMVEKDAPDRHVSFKSVINNIEEVAHFKKHQPYVRLLKQLIFYIVLINIAFFSIAFLKPELFESLINQLKIIIPLIPQ